MPSPRVPIDCGDLDIPVDIAGAAGSSQVVAADARLSVENRAEPVTPVASRVILHPDSFKQFASLRRRFLRRAC